MYGSDPRRGGGGPPGGVRFFSGVLQKFTGPLLGNFNISSEYSAQAQSIGTLSEQIGLRVCGHVEGSVDMWKGLWTWLRVCELVQKSEEHALGCRPRGESSQ